MAVPTASAQAARDATRTIPIVMFGVSDPIGAGLVASFARPGGNVTGLTGTPAFETYAKQMELPKEAVPRARRIAFLWNPANQTAQPAVKVVKEAAAALGVESQIVDARVPEDFEAAFRTMTQARSDALLVAQEAAFTNHFPRLADLAIKARLPSICGRTGYASAGGLMSYSVNQSETVRQTVSYVDRLLRGAHPAELPVEQPSKFELVINAKTARTLDVSIPPSLLARADQVLE